MRGEGTSSPSSSSLSLFHSIFSSLLPFLLILSVALVAVVVDDDDDDILLFLILIIVLVRAGWSSLLTLSQ